MSSSIYRTPEGKKGIQKYYDHYLQQLPITFQRTYVPTSCGNTHVLLAGPEDASPLIILQGGNCISPMTLSWFAPLFSKHRIIAPDTPGHPGYSEEQRLNNDNTASWISNIMDHYKLSSAAFIGPSFGGGMILRLAAVSPEKISCAILVAPAGIKLGSKYKMIQNILLPLMKFKIFSSQKHLFTITNNMSLGFMREIDREITGHIFQHVKLERNMPKLSTQRELRNFKAPTMIVAGKEDIFFPSDILAPASTKIFQNLVSFKERSMGHFPSSKDLKVINEDISAFLDMYCQ
ncbi:alpha/beta fold hydrolase [Bacillus lacus]|uniref:Alpha/beta fold hydrolase n=1 Tax=Metabacillus lacus TaxID=1983721 RepID=A0A7X2IY38_9BACI|nr:alpha/beta hydrolase [Metabacillus lacus]MRX71941.1 alpha/beta fold hydrolase [Metabacillus lacus]